MAGKIVLGFVGLPCAGKGTAIDYLVKKHHFFYSSTSDEIREELKKRNIEITRENLQNLSGQLKGENGPDFWARKAWKKVVTSGSEKAVVDSIRAVPEVAFLKKQKNFYLIAVNASPEVRFQRMRGRNREGDPQVWEDFVKMEEKDKTGGGRNIDACLQMADFTVENNGTIDVIGEQLEDILSKVS